MTCGLSEVIPVHRVVGSHLRVVEVLLPPDVNLQMFTRSPLRKMSELAICRFTSEASSVLLPPDVNLQFASSHLGQNTVIVCE